MVLYMFNNDLEIQLEAILPPQKRNQSRTERDNYFTTIACPGTMISKIQADQERV